MKTISLQSDNIGGLYRVVAFPPASLARVRTVLRNNRLRRYLETTNPDNIIDIPVLPDDSYAWNEEHGRDENGDYYDVNISGIIPRINIDADPVIEELQLGEWVVAAEDQNGELYLSGFEPLTRMVFATTATTGTIHADRNGTPFTFTCRQRKKSILLDDWNIR